MSRYKKSFILSAIMFLMLSFSGGAMDAYSYICRDGVFANAQTGNLLLFSVNFWNQNYTETIKYLFSIIAFIVGIVLFNILKVSLGKKLLACTYYIALILELVILFFVSFLPHTLLSNYFANMLISLVCGIQVEAFRVISGHSVATTMCIGNLRNATHNLCTFFSSHNKSFIYRALLYYIIIVCFCCGAVVESILINQLAEKAILLSTITLILVCLFFYVLRKKNYIILE